MTQKKAKMEKPGISRLMFGAIGLFIVLLIAISLLSSVQPPCNMSVKTINLEEYYKCLDRLPESYKRDYGNLIKDAPLSVDYKATCKIILDKIERDKASGKKE